MAKGLEDTAFYRYNRFVALNEVGGAARAVSVSPRLFIRPTRARRELAARHAGDLDARHQARRRQPRPARRSLRNAGGMARQVEAWSRILRARRGDVERTPPPTATTSTCSTSCCWRLAG